MAGIASPVDFRHLLDPLPDRDELGIYAPVLIGFVPFGPAVPLWSAGRFFHRGYLAAGARYVWSAATATAGRTSASRAPLSADLALRLDTPVGSFNLSLGYALDNAL